MSEHIARLSDGTRLSWRVGDCFVKLIRGKESDFDFGLYRYPWHAEFRHIRRPAGMYIIAPFLQIVPVFHRVDLVEQLVDDMAKSGACYSDWSRESNFTILNQRAIVVDIDKHPRYPGPLIRKEENEDLFERTLGLLRQIAVSGQVDIYRFHAQHAEIVKDMGFKY